MIAPSVASSKRDAFAGLALIAFQSERAANRKPTGAVRARSL
jgi:hypothetical protein